MHHQAVQPRSSTVSNCRRRRSRDEDMYFRRVRGDAIVHRPNMGPMSQRGCEERSDCCWTRFSESDPAYLISPDHKLRHLSRAVYHGFTFLPGVGFVGAIAGKCFILINLGQGRPAASQFSRRYGFVNP